MLCRVFARAPVAALSLLLAGSWAAAAATTPVDEDVAAALRAAWAQHPAAEATDRTLASARARIDAAEQPLYNPDLEAAVEDEGDERTTTVGLSLTLDWSDKRQARSGLARAELSLAEAEAALRRTVFAQHWLVARADLIATSKKVRLGEQRLGLMQRFADLAERQFAVGDISSLERDLALLARDEAVAEQASLQSELASAHEAFRTVGGLPDAVQTDQPLAVPPAWDASEATLHIEASPEGRVALASLAQAEQRITVAVRDRRADPTVSIHGGRVDLGPMSDNVVGVTVSVPLFVRNNFRAEVVAAQADADAEAAELRRIELELRSGIERAVRSYEVMRTAWIRWAQSPGTDVEQRADLLERLWQAGEIGTSEYLVQLKQSLDSALAGADLHGRLWRAYVDALYASGRLDAWAGFDRSASEVTQ